MTASPQPGPRPEHAVVVGAGLDGLTVALALGRRLERVTLVERRDLPDRSGRGDGLAARRVAHALTRVLDCPAVVVRSGLELVGLAFSPGRVVGVVVRGRGCGDDHPVTIGADLVIDAIGAHDVPAAPLPRGLVVIGPSVAGRGGPAGRGAATDAATLARDLDRHLAGGGDPTAVGAVGQLATASPAGHGPDPGVPAAET
jgi:hypothetical protein